MFFLFSGKKRPLNKENYRPLRYENLFNNSSKRPRGAKTTGDYFKEYESFPAKFEECNFQDMYSYACIREYFC